MVVLPAPLGPMIVNTSPASTAKLTSSSARMPPKLIPSPAAAKRLIVPGGGARHGPPHPPALGAPRGTRGAPRSPARPRSPQPLRAHVGLLAPEGRVLVQRERREEQPDLQPAPVDPERLEEDEQHEDEPEDPGLQPRLLDEPVGGGERRVAGALAEQSGGVADPGRHRVASLGDGHRQQRDE